MPLNILELCLSSDYGGLEMHVRDFSRWISSRPDIRLFLALQKDTPLARGLNDLSVPTLWFSSAAGKLAPNKAIRLSRFIEKQDIQLVHVHWKFDLPLVALAKKFSRRKFKFVHTRQMNMPGRKFDPYHRFIYGSMDRFIAITRYIEKEALENLPMSPDRITQIYYGVKLPAEITPEQTAMLKKKFSITGDFTVGLLGRISEYKGQHLLIEAVTRLDQENLRIHAWIIGAPFEPDYLTKLRKMAVVKGAGDRIHFMDFYQNPIELMACFDTVVLTTRNETFGLVLIEAMHAGVPVIGSNAGGVPEIIDHGKTGLLFESWNSESLARQIKRLYDDPDFRRRLARAGQDKARHQFDLDRQYQKVVDVFNDLFTN